MSDQQKRASGPKTHHGKAISSNNATTHGARAQKLTFLPDESPEAYANVRQGWLDLYHPEDYQEERLVEQLILDDWLLQRANRRLDEAMTALAQAEAQALDKSEIDAREHRIGLMLRYKTTAERSFHRSMGALENLARDYRSRITLKSRILNSRFQTTIRLLKAAPGDAEAKAAILTLIADMDLYTDRLLEPVSRRLHEDQPEPDKQPA